MHVTCVEERFMTLVDERVAKEMLVVGLEYKCLGDHIDPGNLILMYADNLIN